MKTKSNVLYKMHLVTGIFGSIAGILLLFVTLSMDLQLLTAIAVGGFAAVSIVVIFALIFAKQRQNTIENAPGSQIDLPVRFLEAINMVGITGIYPNKEFPLRRIIRAFSERLQNRDGGKLKIIAYQGSSLLNDIVEIIEVAIEAGVRVKILIAEDDSAFLEDVLKLEAAVERVPFEEIKKRSSELQEKTSKIIKRLEQKDTKGYFECRRFKTQARYALVAVNNEWAWWTPYQPGLRVKDTTSFVLENYIENNKDTILWQCIKHFRELWDSIPSSKNKQQGDPK